jgi:hypothetical protein
MKSKMGAITAILMTTIMIVVMSLWLGVHGPIWRAAWVAQPADWLGFFGGVVGGFMTLSAAGIAWLAVRMQIASDREIASRGHFQSMRAIKFTMRPLLEAFDILWGIFDETLSFNGTEEEKLSRTTWLQGMFFTTPPETIVDDLKKVSDGLDKDRALLFETVLLRLSNFYKLMIRYSEQKERSDELKWRMSDIQLMRLQIALLKDAVEKFEPAWTKAFTQHRKIPLDDSTYADVMTTTYKLWVAEEAHRRANADH